jgi:hypothetical protein
MPAKTPRTSRRGFLSTAAAASAYVWIPRQARGYTPAEMRAMAPDGRVEVGVAKWDLDTPALCLDLDAFEKNVASMQAALKRYGIASRPHAKTHKCAAIAKYQLATGSIGICCAKLSEAEALAAEGRGQPPDDHRQLLARQDPSRDGPEEGAADIHSGRRLRAERARPVRGSGRGRSRCRRGRSTSLSARAPASRPVPTSWRSDSSSTRCRTCACAGCCPTTAVRST